MCRTAASGNITVYCAIGGERGLRVDFALFYGLYYYKAGKDISSAGGEYGLVDLTAVLVYKKGGVGLGIKEGRLGYAAVVRRVGLAGYSLVQSGGTCLAGLCHIRCAGL